MLEILAAEIDTVTDAIYEYEYSSEEFGYFDPVVDMVNEECAKLSFPKCTDDVEEEEEMIGHGDCTEKFGRGIRKYFENFLD